MSVLDNMHSELARLSGDLAEIRKQLTPQPTPDEIARAQLSELELEVCAKAQLSPAQYLAHKVDRGGKR